MPGALLQLVANSNAVENIWINSDPQITFFKKVYRRHTPFAIELVPLLFKTTLGLGGSGNITLLPHGDLIHRIFFVFDIPKLIAMFLNTKSQDIDKIISTAIISDEEFAQTLKKYINNNNQIEIDRFFNLIDETLENYNNEEGLQLDILNTMENYKDPIKIKDVVFNCPIKQSQYDLRLESELYKILFSQNTTKKNYPYNFFEFKINLANQFIGHKKEYLLIYELLKLIYLSEKYVIVNVPVADTKSLTNVILYGSIFRDLIPNNEILFMFFLKYMTTNDMNQIIFDSLLINEYEKILENKNIYNIFNKYYGLSNIKLSVGETNFITNPIHSDLHNIVKNNNLQIIKNNIYDFGSEHYYMLNAYNIIISVIKKLATTIPVVIAKVFKMSFNDHYNIYQDSTSIILNNIHTPTIIDPNFKKNFLLKINNLQNTIDADDFISNHYLDTDDEICISQYINPYLALHNDQANKMFDNMKNFIDLLFEVYFNKLFSSTEKLFFYNSPPLSNIYGYKVPVTNFKDTENLRIPNVFSTNVWFFYFFKYLDSLNESSFADYAKETMINDITNNGLQFMKALIFLLKTNIEYYMNDISYLLNDLYANSPSNVPSDNMKNYVPSTYNTSACSNFLAITIIFHRNHVPTILEMFQFIYYFISTINIDKINNYLDIDIQDINQCELTKIRNTVKLLYYNIFGYFMNIYDSFHFEAAANFSMDEYDQNDNGAIVRYVQYFLNETPIKNITVFQTSLVKVIAQMEFYFILEMINMREHQKFYHNILFNKKLILDNVGSSSAKLIDLAVQSFIRVNNNQTLNIDKFKSGSDTVRKYWDEMYQHNIMNNLSDNLYYSTFDINRFNGKPYLETQYKSRNYGTITVPLLPPIPFPSTDPYGINPRYYDHNQIVKDHIPFPMTNENILETNIPVYWAPDENKILPVINEKNQIFQLFNIDYFRIRHEIFFKNNIIVPNTIKFIDDYQFNILKLIKLTEQLNKIFKYDKYLFLWLHHAIKYIITYVHNHDINFQNINILYIYLDCVKMSISDQQLSFSQNLIQKISEVLKPVLDQCKPYLFQDLLTNNVYVHDTIIDNKLSLNKNILDKIVIIRNNYLSQYYYYTTCSDSINGINNFNNTNNFTFKNTHFIAYEIINSINKNKIDISFLKTLPSLIFLYPETFPEEIFQLYCLKSKLDDFSQNIINLIITFLNPNTISRPTIKDIYDIVNITFIATKEIYQYLLNQQIFDYIYDKLIKYQPLLLNKIALYDEISRYIETISEKKSMSEDNIVHIANLAQKYGINYDDYYNYININIKSLFDSSNKNLIILNIMLNSDLDYYFLKQYNKSNISCDITFKNYIIDDIFTDDCMKNHSSLRKYFYYINNNNYSYIYFFLDHSKKNNLDTVKIKNPLLFYNQTNLLDEQKYISTQYSSLSYIINVLQYFMDFVWDNAITICNNDSSLNWNNLEYEPRFSLFINNFHLINNKNSTKCDTNNESIRSDRIQNIINAINTTGVTPSIIESIDDSSHPQKGKVDGETNNIYFDELTERARVIDLLKDVTKKNIVLLNKQRKEVLDVKKKIYNILYRNKKAKTAWIKKLGHYIIENITIRYGDDVCDRHISDWFESFHELSKQDGLESGYSKMIGNREDLIIFDDKIKDSYTIVVPLIFYFNKYIASSIPLNASINTKYEINVRLRTLAELTYKEEFSDFVDPNNNLKSYIPDISKSHLMVEYVYLSTEERKIFIGNKLEYLSDELQYDDNFYISDNNLNPIYKMGNTKKISTMIKNGTKIKKEHYDSYKAIFKDKDALDAMNYDTDLLPRNDYIYRQHRDHTGIIKTMMIHEPINNVDPHVHKKRIEYENYFDHPAKLMVVLIKPLIHTNISYRDDETKYFYGEHQWDNYGLYSYYDLSKIFETKKIYYQTIKKKMNDIEDSIFGFVNTVNQILFDYAQTSNFVSNDRTDKWIVSNYTYFLETVQLIKDSYISYDGTILNLSNLVKLKENLLSLSIDYYIIEYPILYQLIKNICGYLKCDIPNLNDIINTLNTIDPHFDINNIKMDNKLFTESINELLSNYNISKIKINEATDDIYKNYNEAMINLFINNINKIFDSNNHMCNITNLMHYFYNLYLSDLSIDPNIINTISLVNNKLLSMTDEEKECLDTHNVKNLTFKDIIYQILYNKNITIMDYYLTQIPHQVIDVISIKMTHKINDIINTHSVELIDYQKNMISNPKINPLISGHLTFNNCNIMPEHSDSVYWSEMQAYQYLNHTPNIGINLHSWSFNAISYPLTGTVNLSKIDKFKSVFDVHPLISNTYPAVIVTMILSVNIIRYLSGMCGKIWESGS